MNVSIDPVPYVSWTDEEFNTIIEEIENSVPDALEAISGAAEQQKKFVEQNISEKRATKQSIPPTDPYYATVAKRLQVLKQKNFYIFQIKNKLDNIQLNYNTFIHLHDLKPHTTQKTPNEEKFLEESQRKLLQRATDPELQQLMESYYDTLPPWSQIGEILKFLRTRFLLMLHDSILHPSRKQEQEEDLILEMLSDLSSMKEFYNLAK